jgi:glycosyltransferase involved in cell wall biosynthesis
MDYSVIIATGGRENYLKDVVKDWSIQICLPKEIIIVHTGPALSIDYQKNLQSFCDFPIQFIESPVASAAKQRNLGASRSDAYWLVFSDDDVRFESDLAQATISFLCEHPEAVAVSPRMRNYGHNPPGKLLNIYYRIVSGYSDSNYGARLIGPAITCYPCWAQQSPPVESNWLPSTLLWIKNSEFSKQLFPNFDGYSLGEDAYLTHRVWRSVQKSGGKLYFMGSPFFEHLCIQSGVKKQRFYLGRMAARNHKIISREAMGLPAGEVFWKLLLHRCFVAIYLIRTRRKGWAQELFGWWSAW